MIYQKAGNTSSLVFIYGDAMQETQETQVWEDPLEKEMATHSLQYSCLENPMDREAWRATVHGATRVEHDLQTKPPPLPTVLGQEVSSLNTEGIKVY